MSNKDITDRASEVAEVNIPETKLTTAQVEDQLIKARVNMLINLPFFGTLATRLNFVDSTAWCPTLATDGKNFYYNKHFVAAMSPEEQIFGVGHEVLHNVYDHLNTDIIGNRDRRLCNIAQDYVINNDLIDAQCGEVITLVQICQDWKYRGMHWMEVYDELFKQAEEEGRVIDVKTLDMHMDSNGQGESEGEEAGEGDDPAGTGNNDGTNGPIKYTKEEKEIIANEMKNAVVNSAKVAGAGNLPAGVKRLVKDLLNPQLDWRQLLAMQIQSVVKSDYTFSTPSRKGMDAGIWLPGMDREQTIDIALALDMSGSIMDEMARDFLSEVKGIMDQYTDFKIHLFCFDTEVHCPAVFTQNNMDEFMDYELGGGGGTEFDCCFDYMKEEGIVPKKLIMFTDGYPWGSWGDENYCDTLFVVHGGGYGGKTPESPFGITVPYERDA